MDIEQIHDLLCGIDTHSNICSSIKNEFFNYVRSDVSTSAIDILQEPLYCFTALSLEEQYFLMQVVTLLGADNLLTTLLSLIETSVPEIRLRWSHVLSLISTVIVCTKGGVSLIRAFIRKILKIVCNNNPSDGGIFIENNATQDRLIDDDAFEIEDNSVGHEFGKLLLCVCLSLARQISIEDPRLTGLTYTQWWSETFCSHPSNPSGSSSSSNSTNPDIFLTRHNFLQFCDFLIDLLPLEINARFLHVQLSSKPFWSLGPSFGNASRTKPTTAKDKENALIDTEVLVGFEDAGVNTLNNDLDLDSLDNGYLNPCVERWNDYVEIAKGRLAELREFNDAAERDHVYQPMQLIRSTSEDLLETITTPGWSDVVKFLDETIRSNSVPATDKTPNCRLPPQLNEANLFRPRWFRSTLIPALLHAPEIKTLSEEYENARLQLLSSLRQTGFSDLLDLASVSDATSKCQSGCSENQKRAKCAKKPRTIDLKPKRLHSKKNKN